MIKGKKILGIVPARKGSKRILNKNIKLLNGIPLITYTFKTTHKAKYLDRLIVSTNDTKVIRIAKEYGVEVPFIRPEKLCDDYATDFDWIKHAYEEMLILNEHFNYIVILRPTSPLRSSKDIDDAIIRISEGDFDSVRSLTRIRHHPYWMKTIDNQYAYPFIETGKPDENLRSQDLPVLYRLNGVVDVINVRTLHTGKLYGEKMGYTIIDENRSSDIDTIEDFEYCEYLIQKGIVDV